MGQWDIYNPLFDCSLKAAPHQNHRRCLAETAVAIWWVSNQTFLNIIFYEALGGSTI